MSDLKPTIAPPESPLALAGVLLMLASAALKSLTTYDPFPAWSGDPLTIPVPVVGLTPVGGLVVDGALTLGASLAALGAARAGRTRGVWPALLLIPGVVVLCLHVRPANANSLDNLLIASSWASAIFAGWAATLVAVEPRCRRVLAAGLLGLIGLWVVKGAAQVFIEHPETLRAFREDRAAFLQSHGWSADSPMARAYERRLQQAEASGWFGMANVYASVMAASLAAMVGLLLARLLDRPGMWIVNLDPAARPATVRDDRGISAAPSVLCAAGAVCACAGVWLGGAKGGFAGALLGLGLIALAALAIRGQTVPSAIGWILRRKPVQWWGGVVLGVAVPLGILAVIALRGAVGTRSGELSLLFRWFYDVASLRIFAASPWTGVGPAGFKDAYMLAKPALSPEDVSSPHSLLFDWLTTLGMAGLGWAAVWLWWLMRAGRALLLPAPAPAPPAGAIRREILWVCFVLAIALVVATRLEIVIATPDVALVRIAGLGLSVALAAAMLVVLRSRTDRSARAVNAGLAAAALVLAAHCQFELTGTSVGAVAWVMLVIGTAAAGYVGDRPSPRPGPAAITALVPAACLAALLACGRADRVLRWEHSLLAANDAVAPLGELQVRYRVLAAGRTREDSLDQLRRDLEAELRHDGIAPPPGLERGEFGPAILALRVSRCIAAIKDLNAACAEAPGHAPTLQAATRMLMVQAEQLALIGNGEGSKAAADEAVARAVAFAKAYPSASAWGWVGTVGDGRAQVLRDPRALTEAIDGWENATRLAPHAVVYPVSLARAYSRLNDRENAARWAREALENDAKAVLDPLQGLSEAVRGEMKALIDLRSGGP